MGGLAVGLVDCLPHFLVGVVDCDSVWYLYVVLGWVVESDVFWWDRCVGEDHSCGVDDHWVAVVVESCCVDVECGVVVGVSLPLPGVSSVGVGWHEVYGCAPPYGDVRAGSEPVGQDAVDKVALG